LSDVLKKQGKTAEARQEQHLADLLKENPSSSAEADDEKN